MDDEFVAYIYLYTSEISKKLNKNFTGVHSVFKQRPLENIDYNKDMEPNQ